MYQDLLLTILGIGIILWGSGTYFFDIVRGRSVPHPYSYLLWMMLVGFNTYILFTLSEWYSFAQGVINTLVCVVFSIMGLYHIRKIERNWFDTFCLILAGFMFLYWYITRDIINTVLITIAIDFLSSLPTLKKTWLQPWTETVKIYASSICIAGLTLITLKNFDSSTIFWVYLILLNIMIIIFAVGRRWYLKGWKSVFE